MTGTLTHARILGARDAGGVVLWDIAVSLPGGGEYKPGEIEAGPYVMAAGLIVGFWMDGGDKRKFVPMGGGRSPGVALARITGSAPVGYGSYSYEWEEVKPSPSSPGQYETVVGGRTSEDSGPAHNGLEAPNGDNGTLGSGIDSTGLPSGFAPVAIGNGAVVRLSGPYGEGAGKWWSFEICTQVDGSC